MTVHAHTYACQCAQALASACMGSRGYACPSGKNKTRQQGHPKVLCYGVSHKQPGMQINEGNRVMPISQCFPEGSGQSKPYQQDPAMVEAHPLKSDWSRLLAIHTLKTGRRLWLLTAEQLPVLPHQPVQPRSLMKHIARQEKKIKPKRMGSRFILPVMINKCLKPMECLRLHCRRLSHL